METDFTQLTVTDLMYNNMFFIQYTLLSIIKTFIRAIKS